LNTTPVETRILSIYPLEIKWERRWKALNASRDDDYCDLAWTLWLKRVTQRKDWVCARSVSINGCS